MESQGRGEAPTGRPPQAMDSTVESCPSAEDIEGFVGGQLGAAGTSRVERHVARCAACRALVSALARTSAVAGGAMAPGLVTPAGGPSGTPDDGPDPAPRIGRYRLGEVLGAGGMAVVHAADDPELGRRVALKLLKPAGQGEEERRALAERLVREARALAQLNHPNVVAVHDVGRAGDQVFLAMELVEGQTVRGWMEERAHGWREVLDVLVPAGRGLEAAHRAGILHRDFKPDNVLVGRDGRVRVTDFGLARSEAADRAEAAPGGASAADADAEPARPQALLSLDPPAGEASPPLTRTGMVLGTASYMAPEQFRGERATLATDQFAFSVTLWEALFGERPFGGRTFEELATAVLADRRRPPAPGVRTPAWLRRAVVRGLSPRPADRHPSMAALVNTLVTRPRRARQVRVLALSLAVLVGAGLLGYRLRAGAGAGAPASQAALCTGARATFDRVWNPGRRRAIDAAFRAAATAPAQVSAGARTAERVAGVFDHYRDGWVAMNTSACRATRVRGGQTEAVLELRMVCLDRRLDEVRSLVDLLAAPGSGDQAAHVIERAVPAAYALSDLSACADVPALTAVRPPPTDPAARRTARALAGRLAAARAQKDAGRYDAALAASEKVLTAAGPLGYRPLEAEAALLVGELDMALDHATDAEAALKRAARAAEAGRHDRVRAQASIDLAFLVGYDQAKYARGAELAQDAAAAIERVGGDPGLRGELDKALGAMAADQGKLDQAVSHFQQAAYLLERARGPDHPSVATALDNLGMALMARGDVDRALALHRRVLAIRERTLGPDHPVVAQSLENLGNALVASGDAAGAEKPLRRAVTLREKVFGPRNLGLATALTDLARAVADQGRFAEAVDLHTRAIDISRAVLGPEHPMVAHQLVDLGIALNQLGRAGDALAREREAAAILGKVDGPGSAQVAGVWLAMGDVQLRSHHLKQALDLYQRALPVLVKADGPTHPAVANALTSIGMTLVEQGRAARAIAPLERAAAIPPDGLAPDLRGARDFALARAVWQTGGDRARARHLAATARGELQQAGAGHADEVAEIARWLAAHGGAPAN